MKITCFYWKLDAKNFYVKYFFRKKQYFLRKLQKTVWERIWPFFRERESGSCKKKNVATPSPSLIPFWSRECQNSLYFVAKYPFKKFGFYELGWLQTRFPTTASCSVARLPLVYTNNFIPIWCSALFYSMPCGSNSRRMYLEPHGPLFESFGRKYIWIILLRSNTNDFHSRFHRADCNLRQCQPWCAAWSEFMTTVCQMTFYDAPSRETTIVWNQPYR